MLGQPPPAYMHAYWDDVADELRTAHHAPAHEIGPAIDAYRAHMTPAGQTIYNDSPEDTAGTIVAHGLLPSASPAGLCVQLTFALTDPNAVLADPTLVAAKVSGLIDALSEYERTLGGGGVGGGRDGGVSGGGAALPAAGGSGGGAGAAGERGRGGEPPDAERAGGEA